MSKSQISKDKIKTPNCSRIDGNGVRLDVWAKTSTVWNEESVVVSPVSEENGINWNPPPWDETKVKVIHQIDPDESNQGTDPVFCWSSCIACCLCWSCWSWLWSYWLWSWCDRCCWFNSGGRGCSRLTHLF